MRCFIALELDEEIKDRLEQAQALFQNVGGRIGWCTRPQMHLTIRFLGETCDEQIPQLVEMLRTAAESESAFEFVVEGLGAFPSSGSPRVLWVGVKPCPPLVRLYRAIEDGCRRMGFAPENRDFTPHLTLGRIKERIDPRACHRIISDNPHFQAGVQAVGKITLFSSRLTPTGAIYTAIAEATLK